MKVNFSFMVRQGMRVAMAYWEEITNDQRPVLLSLVSKDGNKEKEAEITFRFEGGVVVRVFLYDLSQLAESWRNVMHDWVVTHAVIRYYPNKADYSKTCGNCEDKKINVEKGPRDLRLLRENRWWHTPCIMSREEIKGSVGIFWNNASERWFRS